MVKHIVLYTLNEGVDKGEAVEKIAALLEPLVGRIPGLQWLEVCQCYQGDMDYALYSEFDSQESLAAYQIHPEHVAAKTQFSDLIASRISADYEY